MLSRGLGNRILLPSPHDAADYPYTAEDLRWIEERFATDIVGSPGAVEKSLLRFLNEHAPDEIMISTKVFDHADLRRSYELLADLAR